jgi:hypothetical protein
MANDWDVPVPPSSTFARSAQQRQVNVQRELHLH